MKCNTCGLEMDQMTFNWVSKEKAWRCPGCDRFYIPEWGAWYQCEPEKPAPEPEPTPEPDWDDRETWKRQCNEARHELAALEAEHEKLKAARPLPDDAVAIVRQGPRMQRKDIQPRTMCGTGRRPRNWCFHTGLVNPNGEFFLVFRDGSMGFHAPDSVDHPLIIEPIK